LQVRALLGALFSNFYFLTLKTFIMKFISCVLFAFGYLLMLSSDQSKPVAQNTKINLSYAQLVGELQPEMEDTEEVAPKSRKRVAYYHAPTRASQHQVEYIQNHLLLALEIQALYNAPASVTLAQALKESNGGISPVGVNAKNHFGIKKSNEHWRGEFWQATKTSSKYCKYKSVREGYFNRITFLQTHCPNIFKKDNWVKWCDYLQSANYSGSDTYGADLKKIISNLELWRLDDFE
jgi:flagellum-specific peptidoglycan hydrolase FlgJ